jgi:hypothetical protein
MGKISIATMAEAERVALPPGFSGEAETQAMLDQDKDPLHLHLHRLGRDGVLRLGPMATDCVVYVWKGGVEAGGLRLAMASSLIVEHGAAIEIRGRDELSVLLTFRAARPPVQTLAGGHVHLLPAERAPRGELAGTPGAYGALHADSGCPTCTVWLHENRLGPMEDPSGAAAEAGVHSHSEDEIIFVTEGHMRLGTRLYGPGSAIAIPAHTFYGFGVGPEGLSFVNFRAARPSEIKFKGGRVSDEVAFWRDRLGTPQYLEPVAQA